MPRLGVNVSQVAAIREALGGLEPDPVWAGSQAELGGADAVIAHLTTERRPIQDRDIRVLKETVHGAFVLEIAAVEELLAFATEVRPDRVMLVPELDADGQFSKGINASSNRQPLTEVVTRLRDHGIGVALYIEPDIRQIEVCTLFGAEGVELHCRGYLRATTRLAAERELQTLAEGVAAAKERRLAVALGHGIHYFHAPVLRTIPGVDQFNIGHALWSRALFVGVAEAVRELRQIVR